MIYNASVDYLNRNNHKVAKKVTSADKIDQLVE